VQHSGLTYGTLLNRASQLVGHAPTQENFQKGLDALETSAKSSAKVAKISANDLGVAYELRERVKSRLRVHYPSPFPSVYLLHRRFLRKRTG
jgi:hypothetical protein